MLRPWGALLSTLAETTPLKGDPPETDLPKEDPSMFYVVAPRTCNNSGGHPLSILVPPPPPVCIKPRELPRGMLIEKTGKAKVASTPFGLKVNPQALTTLRS